MTGEIPTTSIELYRPDVPEHVLKAVTITYPDIALSDDGLLVGRADVMQEKIAEDLDFWLSNPNVPAENVCSRLSNFDPKNSSQETLLRAASYLVNEGSAQRAMGLIAHGQPGLGKTHVAVGLAKELASRAQGGLVTYINTATQTNIPVGVGKFKELASDGKGTIILDDVNSPYGKGAEALRHAVSAVHDVGGRLFVTSNAIKIDQFLDKALRSSSDVDGIEFTRLMDRVRGLLHPVELIGESYRTVTAQNPWLGFLAIEEAQMPKKPDTDSK